MLMYFCATIQARHRMLRSLLVPAGQSWAIIAYNPTSALHNFKKSLMSSNRPLRPTVDVHPTEIAVFAVAAEHGNIGAAGVFQVSSQQSGIMLVSKADIWIPHHILTPGC